MNWKTLVRQVTQHTLSHPNERDCWQKAVAITGILAWGEDQPTAGVTRWLDRAVATQKSDGNLSYADAHGLPDGHVRTFTPLASESASIGYPLLLRYQQNGNLRYMESARRQIEALRVAPRTADGGIWSRAEGPELWIDFTYLMCPFLALYGTLENDQESIDEAFRQYEVHTAHLIDPQKNLARHAWCERPDHYPQSTFWSRGNGWLLCASVDLLSIAPQHEKAGMVARTCKAVLEAMASYQDASGYFYNTLDDPRSNLEASGTLMFAYAVAKAVELGIVADHWRKPALHGLRAVAGAIDDTGMVPGVAVPPGGPGVPFGWTLFAQGFFLLAVDALKEHIEDFAS